MTDQSSRSAEAQRAAFALVTAALNDPAGFDPYPMLADYMNDDPDPVTMLAGICHVLTYHAVGALIALNDGDFDRAQAFVRKAALMQEAKHHD